MAQEFTIIKLDGPHSFPIEPGAHTVFFDVSQFQKEAIVDVIKNYVKHNPKDAADFIGMALGFYEVPLKDFYPDIKSYTELNDRTLAEMIRWREKKNLLKGDHNEQ